MTRLLASVADLDELALAARGGADILDLKDPALGALGAWPPERIAAAVALSRSWPVRPPLSATVGDLPMVPALVEARVAETRSCGVDYVKVGLFPDGDPAGCLAALAAEARRGTRLVAVLFADLWPDARLLPEVARAGFVGAMLDTAGKGAGGLLRYRSMGELARFVDEARRLDLLTGLAGSLTLAEVASLRRLGPDYLGFRTALCAGGNRSGALDPAALAAAHAALPGPAAAPWKPVELTGPASASQPPRPSSRPSSRCRPG